VRHVAKLKENLLSTTVNSQQNSGYDEDGDDDDDDNDGDDDDANDDDHDYDVYCLVDQWSIALFPS
jgi:hypothetical protein